MIGSAAFVGAASLILAGCGGGSYNHNVAGATTPSSTLAIFGVDPAFEAPGGANPAVSGLGSAPVGGVDYSMNAYLTGAFSSSAKLIPAYGSFQTGFPVGGLLVGQGNIGSAALTTGSYVFRIDIANGQTSGGTVIPVNPTSVSVQNIPNGDAEQLPSDAGAAFSSPMCFDYPSVNTPGGGTTGPTGPLADATYVTGAPNAQGIGRPALLTLPAEYRTTGIHGFRANASDAAGNTVYTDFHTIFVSPADVAIYAQNITPNGSAA